MSGFTGTDVTIGGTAGGTKTVSVTGGPSTYNVAVSGTNTPSTSTDNTVTFQTGAPPAATRVEVERL